MKIPKKPGRPKSLTPEPPGHENMMKVLRQVVSVPKTEIDRREVEYQAKQLEKRDGKPPMAE